MIDVQATLCDEVAVVIGWGRIGTEYARWRFFPVEDQQEAAALSEQIIARKIGRGYRFSRSTGRENERT